jgi:hypothetical protein
MSISISPVINKKLVLVRQLYQSAVMQEISHNSPVSRIMAVIGFDLCVETVLKVVISSLDTKDQPEKIFEAVIQQANDKLQKNGLPLIPDEANIRHVHSTRNDAQHKAKYPTESDVVDCKIYVRDFLEKLLNQTWGIGLEEINIIDLVQNQIAKAYLSKSEEALNHGDYEHAVRQANTGLAWATWHIQKRLFGRRANLSEDLDFRDYEDIVDEGLADAINNAFEPVRNEIAHKLNSIEEALLSVSVGMNYTQFVKLKMILPGDVVGFSENGGAIYQQYLFKKKITEDDAKFALNYCIDAVIQIESQIGDIEKIVAPQWDMP